VFKDNCRRSGLLIASIEAVGHRVVRIRPHRPGAVLEVLGNRLHRPSYWPGRGDPSRAFYWSRRL